MNKNNEEIFILNAARINLSDQNISTLQEITQTDIDWDSCIRTAELHGVSTIIYYSIVNNGLKNILPDRIYTRLRVNFQSLALRNSILLHEFKKLSETITNRIIPLKGIELIQSLYPSIAIRAMCDIDILVEKEYAVENWNSLLKKGFKTYGKSSLHGIKFIEMFRHLPALYGKNVAVEIHWNLFKGSRMYDITQKIWERALYRSGNFYRLTNELMLVHLCSHFSNDFLTGSSLRMLCDINELILKHHTTLDWAEIEEICSNTELKAEVDTALTYSHIFLDTPIPDTYARKEILSAPAPALSSLLKGHQDLKEESFKEYFSSLKKAGNLKDKIVIFSRTLIPEKDWMINRFNVTSKAKIYSAYLMYWQRLFNIHVLKRSAKNGKK